MPVKKSCQKHKLEKGIVQVYTGNGKGKTTAAIGAALRAASHQLHVAFIQFLKTDRDSALWKLTPTVLYKSFGRDCISTGCWYHKKKQGEVTPPEIEQGWQETKVLLSSGSFDLVILDELNVVLDFDFLPLSAVIDLLESRPSFVEVIITGRNAPIKLIQHADLVTEMCEIKHPYQQNLPARQGIEF